MSPRHRPIPELSLAFALTACAASRSGWQASATAQALFDDGKALTAQGKYAEACPKLEESQRLDPGVGTLYRLGDCWEHTGRTASAWSSYLETASLAKAAGEPERERAARKAAQDLEPRLSRVRIVVATPDAEMAVSIDSVSIDRAAWGTAVPLDPGSHTLVARAPNKHAYETNIDVAAGAATRIVEVPPLENDTVPAGPAHRPQAHGLRGQKVAALVVAGAGVVGLGLGTAFAISAKHKNDDSLAYCPGHDRCYAPGVALRNDALSSARYATAFFGIGAAALAGGTLLWVTTPSTRIDVGATSSLLLVRGSW